MPRAPADPSTLVSNARHGSCDAGTGVSAHDSDSVASDSIEHAHATLHSSEEGASAATPDKSVLWHKTKRLGMTESAADAWVDSVAQPVHFVTFQLLVKLLNLLTGCFLIQRGLTPLPTPVRELYITVAACKMFSSAGWIVAMVRLDFSAEAS